MSPNERSRWVARYSAGGYPYQAIEGPMARIPDEMLDCVVYLYPSEAEAEDGKRIGGSGFLIGIPVGLLPEAEHVRHGERPNVRAANVLCVVTNKHVIERGSMTVRLNTKAGKMDIIPLDQAKWYTHPDGDDLAVCPIGLNSDYHHFAFVSAAQFLLKETADFLKIGIGDEIFVVGRFISREGKQRNTPTARFGKIAQTPIEPIVDNGHPQESYLVETLSVPGYSGSAVFVFIPPQPEPPEMPKGTKWPDMSPASRPKIGLTFGPWLLGVDWCHIYDKAPIYDERTGKPVHDWYVRLNTGMMGVIPAWKILDVIGGPEMEPVIKAGEREVLARREKSDHVSHDSAIPERAPPSNDANPSQQEDSGIL